MINPLDQLLEPPDRGRQIDLQWGYITSTAPLRLRNEHEAAPIPATPSKLVDVAVGDRVYYVHSGRKLVILGRAGGGKASWDWRFEHPASVTSGWKTIAYWPGNGRNMSRFTVLNGSSGDHEQLIFEFSLAYSRATIVPISYNAFGRTSPAITGIRYLNDNADATYGPGLLQVRLSTNDDDSWAVHCEQKVDDYLKPMEPSLFSDAVAGYDDTTPRTQVGVTFSDWRILPPTNGWVNYGGDGSSTWPNLRYKMSPGGLIVLEGFLNGGSTTSNNVATLPEGARPQYQMLCNVFARDTGGSMIANRFDVYADGRLTIATPGHASVSWLALNGLTFQAYQ